MKKVTLSRAEKKNWTAEWEQEKKQAGKETFLKITMSTKLDMMTSKYQRNKQIKKLEKKNSENS